MHVNALLGQLCLEPTAAPSYPEQPPHPDLRTRRPTHAGARGQRGQPCEQREQSGNPGSRLSLPGQRGRSRRPPPPREPGVLVQHMGPTRGTSFWGHGRTHDARAGPGVAVHGHRPLFWDLGAPVNGSCWSDARSRGGVGAVPKARTPQVAGLGLALESI